MEYIDTVVIGAGAIGLAIAYELSKTNPDLVVVEKETGFGKHTSSRNSEVIHAGHYYDVGSLKAKLCVQGNELLYDFLEKNAIPFKKTGKIIVATNEEEIEVLHDYVRRGDANGCEGFRLITKEEVQEMEPLAKCVAGLHISSTGIFDTHKFMEKLEHLIEEQGAFVVYGNELMSIIRNDNMYELHFADGQIFQCKNVINSAGLWGDSVATMAGIDIDKYRLRMHWCKGQYYKTTKIKGVEHLIYPVADPKGIFLGIHLTINLAGEVRFGPNAFYLDEIDYQFDEGYFDEFYSSVNRYMDVSKEELMPDDCGIRPKLQGPKDGFRDFYISEETDKGLPGMINLIGIESPGLTASLAIAKYVDSLLKNNKNKDI